MNQLIAGFSRQLREGLAIGKNAALSPPSFLIQNIVVTGLGGSGIGGNLAGELLAPDLRFPFLINKDYFLPFFVNKNSLVIACSYSGNTEETIQALEAAILRKCKIVCITSGGRMQELAEKHKLDCILIPGGMPPRACLGYSFIQQLFVLNKLNLISNEFEAEIENSANLLDAEEADIRSRAEAIAAQLHNRYPVIYATSGYEAVAVRFRQQLNENSKILCWHHVIPEMNHNELVGWRINDEKLCAVLLRNETDFSRNQHRIEINKKIFSQYTPNILEIYSKGKTHFERALYLIHLTDWVSWYLAQLRGVDATEVKVIDFLKGELARR